MSENSAAKSVASYGSEVIKRLLEYQAIGVIQGTDTLQQVLEKLGDDVLKHRRLAGEEV